MMKRFPQSWQDLEADIEEALSLRQRQGPVMFNRFYDSKSAGNLMPRQPADFGVIHQGQYTFIEAKHSKNHESLRSCFSNAVSGSQLASARLAYRAGARYYFVFASPKIFLYEVWDGLYCAEQRSIGKPLRADRVLFSARDLQEVINFCIGKSQTDRA